MRKKIKRRLKKRFYIIAILTAIILCISIIKILNSNFINVFYDSDFQHIKTSSNSHGSKKYTICIDPGHGGFDSGASSPSGILEKDINLKVALKLGKLLEKSNLNITYTRTTDDMKGSSQKKDLQIRCDISNKAKADIYISLHCNFDESSSKTQGTEIWCRFPRKKGEELALILQKNLADIGYTKSRNIKYEANGGLYVLKHTDAVAVLVEMGFLSNKEDSGFLQSETGQDKCAKAMSQSVLEYFGME